ncbi:MAG TPA: glucosaminidase domain-containing protein [Polyangiaceae bacterium]
MASAISTISLGLPQVQDSPEPRAQAAPGFDALLSARARATAQSPAIVPPVRTRLDGTQAADALRSAWTRVTGQPPSEHTVAILTAQWAHETGNGASMYNYNFGGIKGMGPSGLSVSQRTKEGFGASEHTITDRFRAYRTAEEGATDYVKLLSQRFPEAVQAAQTGDPAGFVAGLKQRGYFTGDPGAYTRSVSSLTAQAMTHGYGAIGSHLGELGAPAELNLHATPLATQRYEDYVAGPQLSTPLIDALRIGDEISRAALRIVGQSTDRKDS